MKNRVFLRLATVSPAAFFRLEKMMPVTEKDRDVLARTPWGEARGESTAGQVAVAWTIRNRVFDGKTIRGG